MLYLGICCSFSNINYAAHRHLVCYVLILILANFHAITKIIFKKIKFRLKSQKFYATKIWSYTVFGYLVILLYGYLVIWLSDYMVI